jgi:chloride channel 7
MDGGQSPRPLPHRRAPEREGSHNYDIERMDGAGEGECWQNASSDALLRYDDRQGSAREPMLRKRSLNTTSQIAVVGANVCPIESLDYEYATSHPFFHFVLLALVVYHPNLSGLIFRIRNGVLFLSTF